MQRLGKYTLVRKLATGGMAEVFLAKAEGAMGFQKRLVVKRILPQYAEDPGFVAMFLNEATLAAQLEHPNLVQIFDFGESEGQYFIAMEYIDGPNLRVLNRTARELEGPLPLPLAARIIANAAEGLHVAHELKDEQGRPVNLVHRDISPDNILVSRKGAVKVVDFGIAKATTQIHRTKSGIIKGKFAYMPPEQLAREELDRRADVFALGVVLHELVCGTMPFDSTSEVSVIQAIMASEPFKRARERRADVPAELDAIIARCLEKQQANRYQSCKALQDDLERFIQSTGQVATTGDIAAVVERLFPPESEATRPGLDAEGKVSPSSGAGGAAAAPILLDQTAPSQPAMASAGKEGGSGLSATQLKPVTVAPQSGSRAPLVAAALLVLAAGGGLGTYFALKPSRAAPQQPAPADPPAAVDAGRAVVPAPITEPDAGAAVVERGAVAEAHDAGPAHVEPVAARVGHLELRIRPFAIVYLDGKLLGETPLAPVTATVGRHKLRLVNEKLNKDLVLEVVVRPGENVFKQNLKE